KLTDKQKSRLWELQRNRNFQASRRLEGVEMPLVTLTAAEALAERITTGFDGTFWYGPTS
ncbi:YhfG family protein, partial [Escherichia coli]|uniref:YhfG family protein n=1 Tax=Escherichia coli TaxID=562 RepID=UPI003EDFE196